MILSSVVIGKGPIIIILHGLFGEGKNWLSIAKELSICYEVHLVDQRNHGLTFHHNEHDYALMATDLHAYVKHHNLDRYSVIGHSMGGKVAMQFAFKFPHNLNKLIIVDISPKRYIDSHSKIFQGLNEVLLNSQSRKDAFLILLRRVKDKEVVGFLLKGLSFSNHTNQPRLKYNLNALEMNVKNLMKEITSDRKYTKPIYFLRGENSNYINDLDIQYITNLFTDYIIVTIKNSGHWVHHENKVDFMIELKKILQS